jgi:hypothetical protein
MYIPLAHSTSADSHSVFMPLRVRFDSSHVRASCTILRASTAAQAPKRLEFVMPAPPEAIRTSAAQLSKRFPKKSFRTPPLCMVEKGGVSVCEGKNLFPKIASPIAPGRFGPAYKSDPGALSIATSQIHARAACMCIGHDASDAHGGACSGSSAWRPESVKAPVMGVDKVAHPENSGFPMRMRLRS